MKFVKASKNFNLDFLHKKKLKIVKTISAHSKITVSIFRTFEQNYSSRDTIPLNFFCRARSTSSERRTPGVSPGGRKQVVFAGIEDGSSSSSSSEDDEKHSGVSADSVAAADDSAVRAAATEEVVWVKRPEVLRPKEDDVPVSGVVVAKPSLCQNYPGATHS